MRGLRVLLLGRPRLEADGQALAADLPRKHQALLYHLAGTGSPVSRNELATLLWDDLDEAAARGNLRTALMRLRRALPGVLVTEGSQVGFDPALRLQVDWADLARAAAGEGDTAHRVAAAQAWRGPLLEGFDLGGDTFERWLSAARVKAQQQAVTLRRALAEAAEREGQAEAAEAHWRALLEIDEADEPAHMALMALLARAGRRTAAIAQYEACRATLRDRLGARPSSACYALYTRIHADAVTPSAPAAAVAPPPSAAPASALPSIEGALIGREAELALLAERLTEPGCRWLTLVGPGGVGKTRLALAAAAALAPRFRHGAMWVSGRDPAGALRDAEVLAQQVVARTGADRERSGALLLVLDNLETLPEVAALARGLHARAPGVCVLATSRRRLGAPGEWLLELAGLSLARTHADQPASSPAAALLASAVRRLDPCFDPAAEAQDVERLCERVGGLPLALELAARGVLDTGLPAVLSRLEAGAPLEDRGRNEDERHHSIEVVMRDAWALLPPDARDAALRLAWLPGSFDLPLAEALEVPLTAIEALREQSWLRRVADGTLALHPLQQDFLRRQPAAAPLRSIVRATLAGHIRQALPAVAPFADWLHTAPQASLPSAPALASRPLFSASVLTEALTSMVEASDPEALCRWVDAVVALLLAADRHGEAAALLERASRRHDLPVWRLAGWQMQRAEALNMQGDALAAVQGYDAALARLGLDGPMADGSRWRDLPTAAWRLLRLRDWPPPGPERDGFGRQLTRSLMMYTQQLSFACAMDRAIRANLLALVLTQRARSRAEREAIRVMSVYGLLNTGRPALARSLVHTVPQPRTAVADAQLEAFTREGECTMRILLGRWDGVADTLLELADTMDTLGDHRHAMECHSLTAKLYFYQGRLRSAAERFAETTERSLRRPGGAWRAWGPFGQAEVALCLGGTPDATLQRWVDLGSHWMTEMMNIDTAYALRRFGLSARLAWRQGDVERAREAVLGGVAAATRFTHCGFWAHEGFAGIGEVLLQLRTREQQVGGATAPLDAAWRAFERRLAAHGERFPAGHALVHRLRGEAAHALGRRDDARRWLERAVHAAETQGLRVELARSCAALGRVGAPQDGRWHERATRLWQEMGAAG